MSDICINLTTTRRILKILDRFCRSDERCSLQQVADFAEVDKATVKRYISHFRKEFGLTIVSNQYGYKITHDQWWHYMVVCFLGKNK